MKQAALLLKTIRKLRAQKEPSSDRALFGLLLAGAAIVFIWMAYSLWNNYSGRSVASLLPAEKLTAYVEVENFKLPFALGDSPLNEWLSGGPLLQLFNIQKEALPSWAKKNVGIALVDNEPIVFFRSATRRQALGYLKRLTLADEKLENRGTEEFPIYIYPQGQNLAFTFAGPYLFVSPKATTLTGIYAVFKGDMPSLEESPSYQKAFANLPKDIWMRGYLNLEKLSVVALNSHPLFTAMKQMAGEFSITVRKNQDNFHFNTFLSLKPEFIALAKNQPQPDDFTYGLSEMIHAEDLGAYLGGVNLNEEWRQALASLRQLNPAYGILLEGMLRAQVEDLFGKGTDLEKDIYPLFTGEYALLFSPDPVKQTGVQLIVRRENDADTRERIEKLAGGFRALAERFTPRVTEVTLPNGTQSREVVSDGEMLREIKEASAGTDVQCLDVRDSAYGFCYAVTDGFLIFSNEIEGLKNTLATLRDKSRSLMEFQPFRESLSNLSRASHEITFINLQKTAELLLQSPLGTIAIPYLKNLDTLTWVKHRFDDGVATEGYLLVK